MNATDTTVVTCAMRAALRSAARRAVLRTAAELTAEEVEEVISTRETSRWPADADYTVGVEALYAAVPGSWRLNCITATREIAYWFRLDFADALDAALWTAQGNALGAYEREWEAIDPALWAALVSRASVWRAAKD